jgi:hypothetical protein
MSETETKPSPKESGRPPRVPAWLQRRSPEAALWEEIKPYLHMSLEEKAALVCALARSAARQVEEHPQRELIEGWRDRRSPASEALWIRLLQRARRHA